MLKKCDVKCLMIAILMIRCFSWQSWEDNLGKCSFKAHIHSNALPFVGKTCGNKKVALILSKPES